jgi:hypothetical protein
MHRYELTLSRAVGPRLAASLGGSPAGDGRRPAPVLLTGELDAAGLFGLFRRLRDAGLEIVAVRRLPTDLEGASE